MGIDFYDENGPNVLMHFWVDFVKGRKGLDALPSIDVWLRS